MSWTPIVGRGFSANEFEAYAAGLEFKSWRPSFVVVHNTSSPTARQYAQWRSRSNWSGEQWMRNLESYYKGKGWQAGPHLFVADNRIWTFTPLTTRGTHSPSWNWCSWGVETVGEFEKESFEGPVRENLISVLATLHILTGLNPEDYVKGVRGLHFHKEDPQTSHKNCPGRNINKAMLVKTVMDEMRSRNSGGHDDISAAVHIAKTVSLTDSDKLTDDLWLQQRLNAFGAKVSVTGIIDDTTREAIVKFQKGHNLKPDGIPGPLTRLAIASEPE